MDLTGRVAIVTGGSSNVGRGVAEAIASQGAQVIVADLEPKRAESVANEIRGSGCAIASWTVDVSESSSTDEMVRWAIAEFGQVDILVNGASVVGGSGWFDRKSPTLADWDAAFAVNVRGIVHATQSVESHMKDRRTGKIVNVISGTAGATGLNQENFSNYSASRASAINVTQSYAALLGPFNINVNGICPGVIWSHPPVGQSRTSQKSDVIGISSHQRDQFLKWVNDNAPLRREQTSQDVGKLAVFLCSDRARNITGQAIQINGGSPAR